MDSVLRSGAMGSDLMLPELLPWLCAWRWMTSCSRCCPSGLGRDSRTEWAWRRVGPCLAWVGLLRLGGLDAFSVLVWAGTSLSCVKAFLTGCHGQVLTSYRVWRENRSEGSLRAFWRHVRQKACERNTSGCVDGVKEEPHHGTMCYDGAINKQSQV